MTVSFMRRRYRCGLGGRVTSQSRNELLNIDPAAHESASKRVAIRQDDLEQRRRNVSVIHRDHRESGRQSVMNTSSNQGDHRAIVVNGEGRRCDRARLKVRALVIVEVHVVVFVVTLISTG